MTPTPTKQGDKKSLSEFLYYEESNPDIKIYLGDSNEIMPLLHQRDYFYDSPKSVL